MLYWYCLYNLIKTLFSSFHCCCIYCDNKLIVWAQKGSVWIQKGKVLSVLNRTGFIFSQIPGWLVVAWRTRTASHQVLILFPWFLTGANAAWSLQPFLFLQRKLRVRLSCNTQLLLCICGMLLSVVWPWCCQHSRQQCQFFTFTCVCSWLLWLFLFSWLTACTLLT